MTSLTKGILCEGSPFLPTVKPEHITRSLNKITHNHQNPISVIAEESRRRGDALYNYCSHNYFTLSKRYGFSITDLNHFFNGYSIPLIILIVATSDVPLKFSSKNTSNNDDDKELNQYLTYAIELYSSNLISVVPSSALLTSLKVFDFCEECPFDQNDYFVLGTVSARTTLTEFFTRIDL